MVDHIFVFGHQGLLIGFISLDFHEDLVQCEDLLTGSSSLYCINVDEVYNALVGPKSHDVIRPLEDPVVVLVK